MQAHCLRVLALLAAMLLGTFAGDPISPSSSTCPPRQPLAMFSSKTAYHLVHGKDVTPVDEVEGCSAVYMWQMSRHGTRFPDSKEVEQMTTFLPELQERIQSNANAGQHKLCESAMERLLSWKPRTTQQMSNLLTTQGERDMIGIADRYKQRLPDFFTNHRDASYFEFRSTPTPRTLDSARWYGKGLFGEQSLNMLAPIDKDPLLKFHSLHQSKKKSRPETDAFENSEVMASVLRRVSERLGFGTSDTLSYEMVRVLWTSCAYETAWDVEQSGESGAWCAAFDEEDLQVLVYRDDLDYFYSGGPGSPITVQNSCPLVNDIISKFSSVENKQQPLAGNMYFAHSKAFRLMLSILGVGRDSEQLTASNYERMKSRRWDISQLEPFAANLAVLLYKCPSGEAYRLRTLLNEVPIQVDGCPDGGTLCSFEDFKRTAAAKCQELNKGGKC